MIYNLYQARNFPWSMGLTCHTFMRLINCYGFVQRDTCTAPEGSPFTALQWWHGPIQAPFFLLWLFIIIQINGKIWRWGGRSPRTRFPKPHIELFESGRVLELYRTFSCFHKNYLNNPAYSALPNCRFDLQGIGKIQDWNTKTIWTTLLTVHYQIVGWFARDWQNSRLNRKLKRNSLASLSRDLQGVWSWAKTVMARLNRLQENAWQQTG